MPDIKMPDGAVVRFPDDMPKEQIKSLIASKFPELAQPKQPAPVEQQEHNFGVLPLKWDKQGDLALGMPRLLSGIIDSAKEAYSAPYRAYTGELPMTDESGRTSPEAIAEGFNMASWASPSSVAMNTGKQIARNAAMMNPRAPSEGAQVAQAAQNLGVTLPRAVTSDSAIVQQMGKVTANVPIAGQPLRKASKTAIQQMDDAAKAVEGNLGAGNIKHAGEKIREDVTSFAKVEEPEAISQLYKNVDTLVNPNVRVPLSDTQKVAQNITARRNASGLDSSSAVDFVSRALQRKEGMSYDEIKNLRTAIGELKKNKSELAARKISEKEIDEIYSGLSTDLKNAVNTSGGKNALYAFEKANSAAKQFAEDKDTLRKVLGEGSDEKTVANLLAKASDSSRADIKGLMLAKSKVSKETWDELASAALADMGRDASGAFTPDRLVTEWGKMSESGKKLLFGSNPEHLKALNDIATVSTRFKKLNEYANPSGTGMTTVGSSYIAGSLLDPMTTASALLGTFVTAKFLASPARAKAVADYAKAYEVAARMPGQTSQNMLANKAKALALVAANGNEAGASNLAAKLATVQQTAATDQGDEQVGRPVGYPEPDKASDEFNSLYQQGRAF